MKNTLVSFAIPIILLVSLFSAPIWMSDSSASNADFKTNKYAHIPPTLEWQLLRATGFTNCKTYRAKVPGGWLVATAQTGSLPVGTGTTFVPDPDHSWNADVAKNPDLNRRGTDRKKLPSKVNGGGQPD